MTQIIIKKGGNDVYAEQNFILFFPGIKDGLLEKCKPISKVTPWDLLDSIINQIFKIYIIIELRGHGIIKHMHYCMISDLWVSQEMSLIDLWPSFLLYLLFWKPQFLLQQFLNFI